jgi:protein gp37
MSDKTGIEWTDSSWNPIVGCSLVSPGCTNCYAMKAANRLLDKPGSHYDGTTKRVNGNAVWTGKLNLAPEHILTQPLRWKRPRKIFVNSMSDLFHEGVPDEWIDRVFTVMALTSRHTYQVLTKRPARMHDFILRLSRSIEPLEAAARAMGYTFHFEGISTLPWPIPNVWLGVSVERQKEADERIPLLTKTPAAVRFISAEPLLGPINLAQAGLDIDMSDLDSLSKTNLHWVIVGGESGKDARPMHPAWARSLRDQCIAAGVPYFFKQWGSWRPMEVGESQGGNTNFVLRDPEDRRNPMSECFHMPHSVDACITDPKYGWRYPVKNVGKKAAGRLLDGRTWDEFPDNRAAV